MSRLGAKLDLQGNALCRSPSYNEYIYLASLTWGRSKSSTALSGRDLCCADAFTNLAAAHPLRKLAFGRIWWKLVSPRAADGRSRCT